MDRGRIKRDDTDVALLAVGICRTNSGNTHTGIVHRQAGQLHLFEQAWHHVTRNDPFAETRRLYTNGACFCIVPPLDDDRAKMVAGLCRLIARSGQQFTYCLRFDSEATVDPLTGELT